MRSAKIIKEVAEYSSYIRPGQKPQNQRSPEMGMSASLPWGML